MKICKFLIEVSCEASTSSITDSIPDCYLFKQNRDEYKQFCLQEQMKLPPRVQVKFGEEGVVAFRSVRNVDYFIFRHKEHDDSGERLCFDVLLKADVTKLTDAIMIVFCDIENTLAKGHMKVAFCEKTVYVFLIENGDFLEKFYYVKALFLDGENNPVFKRNKEKKKILERKRITYNCVVGAILIFIILIVIIVDLNIDEDLFSITTGLMGLFIGVPAMFFMELKLSNENSLESQDAIVVNDFDQEWFSQDIVAEATVEEAAAGGEDLQTPTFPPKQKKEETKGGSK